MEKTREEFYYSEISNKKSSDDYDPYEYIYDTWEKLNKENDPVYHVSIDWDWGDDDE